VSLVAIVMTMWCFATATPNAGQTPASGPRGAATRPPDLNGIWQAVTPANWDLQAHSARPGPPQFGALFSEPAGMGVVEGNEIPYQPWARAKQQENFAKRYTADPEAKCYMPGVPRATYMPYPFQIVQTPPYILVTYAYARAFRTIHMNRPKPNPIDVALDTWMGYSSGRWDGRTLVVEVSNLNDQTWFDRAGNFHSDALKVVERYTPVDADHLAYEATIEDPQVFTRPWTISLPLYRVKDKNAELLHFACIEFAEEMLYGLHGSGPTSK
jgi:hypothetical protein